MASPDRIGAAYHEAGHAVVAWALGLPVIEIAIAVGGDAAGRSGIGVADHLSKRQKIAVLMAGRVAQQIFEAPTHDRAGAVDHAMIMRIVGDMPESESWEFRNGAALDAREIIIANRAKVERLAQHLIDNGSINGADFLTLMNAAD
jgi:ATP-dependent Zn protease